MPSPHLGCFVRTEWHPKWLTEFDKFGEERTQCVFSNPFISKRNEVVCDNSQCFSYQESLESNFCPKCGNKTVLKKFDKIVRYSELTEKEKEKFSPFKLVEIINYKYIGEAHIWVAKESAKSCWELNIVTQITTNRIQEEKEDFLVKYRSQLDLFATLYKNAPNVEFGLMYL